MTDILAAIRKAKALLQDIPPPPFFASSVSLLADRAIHFSHTGREYIGAHPDFWQRMPATRASTINPFVPDLVIHNVDLPGAHREAWMDAIAGRYSELTERGLDVLLSISPGPPP